MKRVITSLLAILFVLPMVFPLAACTTETGGENMANYLYNGVELPDINSVWTDKETYPYAIIGAIEPGLEGYYALGLFTTTGVYNSGNRQIEASSSCSYLGYVYGSGEYGEYDSWTLIDQSDSAQAGSALSYEPVTWSNYDILNADGSVYLAASTPVPVGGSKLTISTGGSANGDGMALYNGVMLPKLPEWDKTKYPYATIFGLEVPESELEGGGSFYHVVFSTIPTMYCDGDGGGFPALPAGGRAIEVYSCFTAISIAADLGLELTEGDLNKWLPIPLGSGEEFGSTTDWSSVSLFPPIWSNGGVLHADSSAVLDGTNYIEPSDPIPLDGMNVITWDGDTTGLPSVNLGVPYYRIADYVPATSGFCYAEAGTSGADDTTGEIFESNGSIWTISNNASGPLCVAVPDEATAELGFEQGGIYVLASGGIYVSALAYTASSGGVTDTTATVNFSCKDLLYTDSVYKIMAWVYEQNVVTWDGDTTGLTHVADYYKVSDLTPTRDEIAGFTIKVFEGGAEMDAPAPTTIMDYGSTDVYGLGIEMPFVLVALKGGIYLDGLTIPEAGIYFLFFGTPDYVSSLTWGGLDTTQPPTFTSEVFAGPSHTENFTVTGLTPATEYGIYAVIWSETDGAATEHNATATFTTLEGEAPTVTIQFGAVNITDTGFTAVIEASGLDDATAYTAEIVVYNTATSAVAAEAVRSFTGNYTMAIDFAGLTPETDYTVSVDVYPSDTGKVVARGEFPVATGQEEPKTSWRDSFLLGFASGLGCTAATKTDADHNAWMQGYLVGDALRSAITTQQGFRYEVPDLQATVRMVAECFTESGDTLLFNAHNGSMILGVSTQNEATFTDRTDVTKYLIPIPAEASKVTVETSDPKVTLAQFIGVNGSGGNYTQVFSSAREAVYSYEFPKGAAQYMAIDLIYEDKGAVTVPWDYVLADTTVTFT